MNISGVQCAHGTPFIFSTLSPAGAYDAQVLVNKYKDEIGIEILDFPALVYIESLNAYVPADKAPKGEKPLSISGTKFREMMNAGDPIPEWFSHPDVIKILRVCFLLQCVCVWGGVSCVPLSLLLRLCVCVYV